MQVESMRFVKVLKTRDCKVTFGGMTKAKSRLPKPWPSRVLFANDYKPPLQNTTSVYASPAEVMVGGLS